MKSQKVIFVILFVLINSQKFLNNNKPPKPNQNELKPPKENELNNQMEDKIPIPEQLPEQFNNEKPDFPNDRPNFPKGRPDFQKQEFQQEKLEGKPEFENNLSPMNTFREKPEGEPEFENNLPPMNDDFNRRRPKNRPDFEEQKDFNELNQQGPQGNNNQQAPQ